MKNRLIDNTYLRFFPTDDQGTEIPDQSIFVSVGEAISNGAPTVDERELDCDSEFYASAGHNTFLKL